MDLEGESECGQRENKWRDKDRNKRSVSKTGQKINGLRGSSIFHVSLKCLKSQDLWTNCAIYYFPRTKPKLLLQRKQKESSV